MILHSCLDIPCLVNLADLTHVDQMLSPKAVQTSNVADGGFNIAPTGIVSEEGLGHHPKMSYQ